MTSSVGTLEKEVGENVCAALPLPSMYDFKQMDKDWYPPNSNPINLNRIGS